jgi:uncharacterized membrane protein
MKETPPPETSQSDSSSTEATLASPHDFIERIRPFIQPERVEEAAQVVQAMLIQQSHIGPLPTAREFQGYESALPGAAHRILMLAEAEQAHRHALERKVVERDLEMKARGQWFSLIALIAILSVVVLFAYLGFGAEGAMLGGGVIIGVIALFLGQKWRLESRDKTPDARDDVDL